MPVLASDVVAGARREMRPLVLGCDAADDAGTKLGILLQLNGDVGRAASITAGFINRCLLRR